jgi:hypothetical protein
MGGFRGQRKTMKLRDYVNSFDEYVLDAEANGSAVPYLRCVQTLDCIQGFAF